MPAASSAPRWKPRWGAMQPARRNASVGVTTERAWLKVARLSGGAEGIPDPGCSAPRPRKTSPCASARVLPCSRVTLAASSSLCRWISSCGAGAAQAQRWGRAAAEARWAVGQVCACLLTLVPGSAGTCQLERAALAAAQEAWADQQAMLCSTPPAHPPTQPSPPTHLQLQHDPRTLRHRRGAPPRKGIPGRLHRRVELLGCAQGQPRHHLLQHVACEGGGEQEKNRESWAEGQRCTEGQKQV